jgi:hypothetical protein
MRAPFRTEDELIERLSKLGEVARFDYKRRIERANVAVLAAFLAKEQAGQAEARASSLRSQVRKLNIVAVLLIAGLGLASLTTESQNLRVATTVLMGFWAVYIGAVEILLLPHLTQSQTEHWYSYQVNAREWSSLLGVHGFAEHINLAGSQFKGDASTDEASVELAIRGFALLKAESVLGR